MTRAVALYYGSQSTALFPDKKSTPALAVNKSGTIYYGYLATGNASGKININYSGNTYNLTAPPACSPGTYSADGFIPCIDCGLGHYCAGGMQRAACTGGAIGCNGTKHAADVPAPTFANRELTLAEVTANVPSTNFSQWKKLSSCASGSGPIYGQPGHPDTNIPCATGTIGPGTYLFMVRYSYTGFAGTTDIFGSDSTRSNVRILIFDHPVSYKTFTVTDSFWNWVDLNHTTFTNYSFQVPQGSYYQNNNYTNVSGMPGSINIFSMSVFELN